MPPPSLLLQMGRRARRHAPLKAAGTMTLMALFFVAYFALLRSPQFPVTPMPVTALDRWLPFQPAALPLYASLWLYVSLPPAFILERRRLVAYGWAIASLCAAGLLIFLVWPTATPAALVDWDRHPAFAMLKGLDTNGNACPSLHVATAAFSACWLHRLLREMGAGRAVLAGNALWCAAIVYSTLATKQHVLVDVVGGLALSALWLAAAGPRALAQAKLEQAA